jgi:protein-S-isoprenylcysteine O-methyltransferase Ste14
MNLKTIVGSGDRIGLLVLPFIVVGVSLNLANPAVFTVGGPPAWLGAASIAVLAVGVTIWIWTVVLILMNVPQGRLMTGGPYALIKHPLYTTVALLVLPWVGFLLDSWVGVVIGIALYVASRMFAPARRSRPVRDVRPCVAGVHRPGEAALALAVVNEYGTFGPSGLERPR